MGEDVPYEGRRDAFDELLHELGSQLSKINMDSIEFREHVPDEQRERGGIKLLEYLMKHGRFSVWRTESLHGILARIGRCDLADFVRDRYQNNFPDLSGMAFLRGGGAAIHVSPSVTESPKPPKRASTQYERKASSLLVRSRGHCRSNSSPVLPERFSHRRQSSLDLAARPVEEENTASGTHGLVGGSHTRGFAEPRSPSRLSLSSGYHQCPVQEADGGNSTPGTMTNNHRIHHSSSCDECRLKKVAIDAVVRIVESRSCTDIGRGECADDERLRSRSASSLPATGAGHVNDSTPTLTRRPQTQPRSGEGDTITSLVEDNLHDECDQASPSAPVVKDQFPGPEGPITTNSTYSRKLKLPRPLSGYRKPQDSITWEVKRDRLVKCLNKSGEEKLVFGEKIDLDVGHGKHNPKLSLVLHPKGLFANRGKTASLQASISASDKCPPLSPSLLLHLNVVVYGSQKQRVLNRCLAQETVNMRSFFIHNLFSCDRAVLDAIDDHVLLEISVQIQKASEL